MKMMSKTLQKKLDKIAIDNFGWDLKTQGLDRLDFKTVGVWFLRDALVDAYELGKSDTKK